VLNIQGVRIGPAEIYSALRDVSELGESLALEQRGADPSAQSQVALLVVLRDGHVLDAQLERRIRYEIARNTTPLHVPRLIVAVPELPSTHTGKRSERAATDALNGAPVANLAALGNPESIEQIRGLVAQASARALAARAAGSGDSTEERLRAIWQSVLERDHLDSDENFFDAGGSSLAAMRMFVRIREELGIDLPASSLLRAPTIAALVALIDAPDPGMGLPIELAAGTGGRPVFLLPWWTGEVFHLRVLATRIATDRPIYGVAVDQVDETIDPSARVAEMAARCVQSMRRVQPSGPYAFIGHSFGGLLGLEVALILSEQGEEVEFFGAVDTAIHHRWHSRGERIGRCAQALLGAGPGELRRLAFLWIREHTKTTARLHGAAQRAVNDEVIAHRADPAGTEAWRCYRPRPWAGALVLFRAERSQTIFDSLPLWRRTALGGVTVEDVRGEHRAGLDERAVDELALQITTKL
jgi:acetoacetyl-CoA synthetase